MTDLDPQIVREEHRVDENGNPAGGTTDGIGFAIEWQNGPFMGTDETQTGAVVEGVIEAVLGRLEWYQSTKFKCRENALAITKLEEALHWMRHRQMDRKRRGVQGRHER